MPSYTSIPRTDLSMPPSGAFPPEIWILIGEIGGLTTDALARLARTCRTLNHIVTPLLWEHVTLSRPQVYSFVHPPAPHRLAALAHVSAACARSIKRHDDVAACVKKFTLKNWYMKESAPESPDYPANEAMNHAFDHVVSALLRCPNLETIHLWNVQIPPRLHRALYQIPSLRRLVLEHCIVSCHRETCAMNPQRLPIRDLELYQTAQSIHGYNNIVNSVEALAQASGLQSLQIDHAIFDQLMNLYITRGFPDTLESLRATPPQAQELSGALLTDFLSFPNNPIRTLSLLREIQGFVPERILPVAVRNLAEVAGPRDVVLAMVRGRAVGGIKIVDQLRGGAASEADDGYFTLLEKIATGSRADVTTLALRVDELDEKVLTTIATLFPRLQDLVIEYAYVSRNLLPKLAHCLLKFVSSLPYLSTLRILIISRLDTSEVSAPDPEEEDENSDFQYHWASPDGLISRVAERELLKAWRVPGGSGLTQVSLATRKRSWKRPSVGYREWMRVGVDGVANEAMFSF